MDRLAAMRNFVAVVETGGFSRAAKQLAVAAGRLKPLFTGWETLNRPVFVVHPHKRHVPAKVRVFADFIESLFREFSPAG